MNSNYKMEDRKSKEKIVPNAEFRIFQSALKDVTQNDKPKKRKSNIENPSADENSTWKTTDSSFSYSNPVQSPISPRKGSSSKKTESYEEVKTSRSHRTSCENTSATCATDAWNSSVFSWEHTSAFALNLDGDELTNLNSSPLQFSQVKIGSTHLFHSNLAVSSSTPSVYAMQCVYNSKSDLCLTDKNLSPLTDIALQTSRLQMDSPAKPPIHSPVDPDAATIPVIRAPVPRHLYMPSSEEAVVPLRENHSLSMLSNYDSDLEDGEIADPPSVLSGCTATKRKWNKEVDNVKKMKTESPDFENPSNSKFDCRLSSEHKRCRSETPHRTNVLMRNKRLSLSGRERHRSQSSHRSSPSGCSVRYGSSTFVPSYNVSLLNSSQFSVGFIDSHCHLDFLFKRSNHSGSYEQYRSMFKEDFPVTYEGCVAVFCDPFTFKQKWMWKPIVEEEGVWATFGCHPHYAHLYDQQADESLLAALAHKKVRALGEIGLDYSSRNNCDRKVQHKIFKRQLQIALKKKLPLVIHCRDAYDDCYDIMKEIVPDNYPIHLHCFANDWPLAKKWLDAFPKLLIGLTNVVTYSSATDVHEVAKRLPLNRLLLETDAPYFLPRVLPKSLRWSHPGMAIHVAAQVAAIKCTVTVDDVLKAVRENTRSFYKI